MDRKENINLVSLSLATVIRQSLNSAFRKECHLLLKVSNNRDVQDTINALLAARPVKTKACVEESTVSPALSEGLEEVQVGVERVNSRDTQFEAEGDTQTNQKRFEAGRNTAPADPKRSLPDKSTGMKTLSSEKEPVESMPITESVQEACQDALSDDETQFDWDEKL